MKFAHLKSSQHMTAVIYHDNEHKKKKKKKNSNNNTIVISKWTTITIVMVNIHY